MKVFDPGRSPVGASGSRGDIATVRPMAKHRAAALAAALLMAACGGSSDDGPSTQATGASDAPTTEASGTASPSPTNSITTTSGAALPDIAAGGFDTTIFDGTAMTVAGAAFDLGDLAGSDLVVWFWAPW